jgi:hypothetical protein
LKGALVNGQVYVLMHSSEVQLLEEQRQAIRRWIQKSNGKWESKSSPGVKYDVDKPHAQKSTYGGALWDIFRREDTPKLQAYLGKHWEEFCIPGHWVVESVRTHSSLFAHYWCRDISALILTMLHSFLIKWDF